MHLSVICSEDMPFGADDVEALSADTFLGLHLYQRYNAACQRWVRGPIAIVLACPNPFSGTRTKRSG